MALQKYQKPKPERDQKVVQLRKEGLSYAAITKKIKELGMGTITRQRAHEIYKRNI